MNVVCIDQKKKKKRQKWNRLYPRVTLIPPHRGRIMAVVMAVQHFSSSFLLDFHPAGKPHGVHMMEPISKDNTQTRHPSWAPAGLLKRQSKEVMFCVPFGGWREERRCRKSNKCVCGNRDHLSLVFALLKRKKKRNAWQSWLMKLERGSSKSPSTWRSHGYNNPHSRKRWWIFCGETLAPSSRLSCRVHTVMHRMLQATALA